ncbi:cyun8 [Cyclophragma undans nucleopolyhedrovirus]|uniref:Cyun8 n=1 Tax=Cyclophragma undans nucleopolyhedrovirus TaxID=1906244 RepID=A0A288Q7F8_9ABAC|nr:cyun8 [Cyclophragma undans nucleopolyhedrovirus]AOT85478.1 cyun8 [Cyclophragma undans nucleopolyhedrovirus]
MFLVSILYIVVIVIIVIFITIMILKSNTNDDIIENESSDNDQDEFSCYQKPFGLYPHPTKCNAYYMCFGTVDNTILLHCSYGFEFDPDQQQCVPNTGNCIAAQTQVKI